ncbi:MAG: phosphoserine phosphatase SerB [Planctomycetes bacterium]|nr:phosphoserine phosphatase SerB [Planctomycetota bacterium]
MNRATVIDLLRRARAVCFDVDSTACADEGIDVLAAFKGVGPQVAALTANAMGGAVKFEDALAARLALIQPSRTDVKRCLAAHPPRLTPGFADLVARLRARGAEVFLISGGFEQMIAPVAAQLAFDADHVIANRLRFTADGAFAGVDPACPTARSGGKAVALAGLRARGLSPLVMIGDGVTDLEARPPADCFIGFGGVVVRPIVRDRADWFVTGFAELSAALVG